jgi:hypothetical protein
VWRGFAVCACPLFCGYVDHLLQYELHCSVPGDWTVHGTYNFIPVLCGILFRPYSEGRKIFILLQQTVTGG